MFIVDKEILLHWWREYDKHFEKCFRIDRHCQHAAPLRSRTTKHLLNEFEHRKYLYQLSDLSYVTAVIEQCTEWGKQRPCPGLYAAQKIYTSTIAQTYLLSCYKLFLRCNVLRVDECDSDGCQSCEFYASIGKCDSLSTIDWMGENYVKTCNFYLFDCNKAQSSVHRLKNKLFSFCNCLNNSLDKRRHFQALELLS